MTTKTKVPRTFTLIFEPQPGGALVMTTIGFRALELLNAIPHRGRSRAGMLRAGRPRIALNAPSTVSALRTKRLAVTKTWVHGVDEAGNQTRWIEYRMEWHTFSLMASRTS